jgi:hypothetical protein
MAHESCFPPDEEAVGFATTAAQPPFTPVGTDVGGILRRGACPAEDCELSPALSVTLVVTAETALMVPLPSPVASDNEAIDEPRAAEGFVADEFDLAAMAAQPPLPTAAVPGAGAFKAGAVACGLARSETETDFEATASQPPR